MDEGVIEGLPHPQESVNTGEIASGLGCSVITHEFLSVSYPAEEKKQELSLYESSN